MAEIGGGDVPMDEPRRYLNKYCDMLDRERDALKAENARLFGLLERYHAAVTAVHECSPRTPLDAIQEIHDRLCALQVETGAALTGRDSEGCLEER